MYECYKDHIVEGRESFPIWAIISENVLFMAIWALAGYLLWPIWIPFGIPIFTVLWGILVVVIQILLKKHNCSGCYYYDKLCHLGWGKISSAFFKQDSGDPDKGKSLSLFYILSPPLILVTSIGYMIITDATWTYRCMLILFVLLNMITFPIRKKGCGVCAMRTVCPGSAAKK